MPNDKADELLPTLEVVPEAVREAVLAVVDAVREFIVPDGISDDEFANRVIEATDNPEINPYIRMLEGREAVTRTLSPPETELSAPTRRMEEILNAKLTPRKATPAPETGELVERIKAGLDLANRLSGDVPITAAARKQLTDAYAALASIPEVYGKSHTPETGELVTQADREAAADFLERMNVHAWEKSVGHIRAGDADAGYSVQAFAAHRRAALASMPSVLAQGDK